MTGFEKFLMDYWHQDYDLLFNSIEEAVFAFRKQEGEEAFERLISEVSVMYSSGQFELDDNSNPRYEAIFNSPFQTIIDDDDARRIISCGI